MSIEPIPEPEDHLQAILSYDLEQYKESKALSVLIKTLIFQLQRIEDTFLDLQLKRFIGAAFGYTLDLMGSIVGELRNFKNDNDYRTAILVRALINNGGGTPEDIISAIRILYAPRKIEYSENTSANFSLFIQSRASIPPEIDPGLFNIRSLIKSIKPMGVGEFNIVASSGDNLFRFSDSTSELLNFLVNSPPEQNLDINETSGVSPLYVEADTMSSSAGSFGFGEFILASSIVVGGGTLAEIINYA
jgi:hypothetical protein